jgi:Tfp pilus assembly protein PilZ
MTARQGARRTAHSARPVREHERRKVELRVTMLDEVNRVRGKISFDSSDLSLGGAFVRSDLLFEVHDEVQMEFTLPESHRVRARGRIVRVIPGLEPGSAPGMGIKFVDLSDTDREAVRAFIDKL